MAITRAHIRKRVLDHINRWIKENNLVDYDQCPVTAVQSLYDPDLIFIKLDNGNEPSPYNIQASLLILFQKGVKGFSLENLRLHEVTPITSDEALDDFLITLTQGILVPRYED